MRAKDSERLGTIRLLLSAIKQREVDERITLTDTDIMSIINKMVKQRVDAKAQFESGNRPDLATKEQQEMDILKTYLPEPLDETAIEAAIQAAITTAQATSIRDMAKVMAILKGQLTGRADMAQVSAKVKHALT